MMMMATSIAHGSIDLNAQYAEGDYRQKMDRKSLGIEKSFGAKWVQQILKRKSQLENRWGFRRLRKVAQKSTSLLICGRAFQSLEAESETALKPSCFLMCFSVALGTRRRGWDDERRDRTGIYRGMSSCNYSGAFVAFVCQGRDLVIDSLSLRKPMKLF